MYVIGKSDTLSGFVTYLQETFQIILLFSTYFIMKNLSVLKNLSAVFNSCKTVNYLMKFKLWSSGL